MTRATILDWTEASVQVKLGMMRDVKYQVYRDDSRHYLELCSSDGEHIHTLELPDGMKLDRTSYEVLLRYVLLDVVAA